MLKCIIILFITRITLVASEQANKFSGDVLTKLAGLEERLEKQENEITNLRKSSVAKEVLITKQQYMLEKQASKINALEIQFEEIRASRHELESITRNINELQQKCDHTGKVNRAIDGGIAFSAYKNHDQNFGAGQTIKFNQIITNEGNGYNANTGVFTCPEDGMYLFTFFVGERSDKEALEQIYADLKVNTKNVIDAVAETRHITEDAQGGNSVVVRLAQGDSVWISARGSTHHIEGDASRISSFTGVFLYV